MGGGRETRRGHVLPCSVVDVLDLIARFAPCIEALGAVSALHARKIEHELLDVLHLDALEPIERCLDRLVRVREVLGRVFDSFL